MTKFRLALLATTTLTVLYGPTAPSHAQGSPLIVAQNADEKKEPQRGGPPGAGRPAPAAPQQQPHQAAPPTAAPPQRLCVWQACLGVWLAEF